MPDETWRLKLCERRTILLYAKGLLDPAGLAGAENAASKSRAKTIIERV